MSSAVRKPARDRRRTRGPRVSAVETVEGMLRAYASRGVFRSIGPVARRAEGKCTFQIVWHHNRLLDLTVDTKQRTVGFASLLPAIAPGSMLHAYLLEYVASCSKAGQPLHLRVDASKAKLVAVLRKGAFGLIMKAQDGDMEYAARKLIHIVHDLFARVLRGGPFYEYCVESLGVDPDRLG